MSHSFRLSIYLDQFLPISSIYIGRFFCASEISSSLEFVPEMTIDFMQNNTVFDQRVENITSVHSLIMADSGQVCTLLISPGYCRFETIRQPQCNENDVVCY